MERSVGKGLCAAATEDDDTYLKKKPSSKKKKALSVLQVVILQLTAQHYAGGRAQSLGLAEKISSPQPCWYFCPPGG